MAPSAVKQEVQGGVKRLHTSPELTGTRPFVSAEASGRTVGPYCDIVLPVPVVSLQD